MTIPILGANYSIWNNVAPGQGLLGEIKLGDSNAGHLKQMNDGKENKSDFGGTKDGSLKYLIAADAQDTIQLTGGGWGNGTYQVDSTTNIGGMYFKRSNGDQILISGGAKIDILPEAAGSGEPKKEEPKPVGDATPKDATKADVEGDIASIEKALNHGEPNGVLDRREVEDIAKLDLPDVDKGFWAKILENWDRYDNNKVGARLGLTGTQGAGDNAITAEDIAENNFIK